MPNSFFDARTKPNHCFLGVALPLSKKDLELGWNDKEADFIQHMKRSRKYESSLDLWEVYKSLANSLIRMMDEVEKQGVYVVRRLNVGDLATVKESAIAIFAHYSKKLDRVELSDGLFTPEQFANSFSGDYSGVIDLTLCNSINLEPAIKGRFKSKAMVISNTYPARLSVRIILYKHLIKYLNQYDTSYISAVPKIRKMITQ